MSKNFESQFEQIDDLLNEVEQSTSEGYLLAEIDGLCSEIDGGVETRKQEIEQWPLEQKRKEAADSQDPFVLNILSMDKNFNVRTLTACNMNTPANSLKRLVENANDYIRMIIANHPNLPPEVLDRIAELSDEQEIHDAVRNNPKVSAVTKFKIENHM